VSTSSGDVEVSGVFAEDTRIQTSSGDVTVRLAAGSDTRISVRTSSGSIDRGDLILSDVRQDGRSLTARVRDGHGLLTIGTSSGDVHLQSTF
jgi:DUF4097 and DUF4098 domain-containing protein YvlB